MISPCSLREMAFLAARTTWAKRLTGVIRSIGNIFTLFHKPWTTSLGAQVTQDQFFLITGLFIAPAIPPGRWSQKQTRVYPHSQGRCEVTTECYGHLSALSNKNLGLRAPVQLLQACCLPKLAFQNEAAHTCLHLPGGPISQEYEDTRP